MTHTHTCARCVLRVYDSKRRSQKVLKAGRVAPSPQISVKGTLRARFFAGLENQFFLEREEGGRWGKTFNIVEQTGIILPCLLTSPQKTHLQLFSSLDFMEGKH